MTDTEKLLRYLIALPSVNPAFLPPNDPHAGEKRVADFVAAFARRAGLDVHFEPVFPNRAEANSSRLTNEQTNPSPRRGAVEKRANVIATLSPAGTVKHRILLAPHFDTVNVVSEEGFIPRTANGRIHGRGACDDKGAVAAMLTALAVIARGGQRPASTEIVFAGLMDEENAQAGSRALAASGFKADLAIVGEPTRLQIVTAHKGSLWLRLETRGKAAHGSCPHLGKNAVHTMAQVVDILETSYARHLRKRQHSLLGHATVNVGLIQGGTQPNIVPASCTASVDRRTIPGETEGSVRAQMTAWLRRQNVRASISSDKAICPPLETDPRLPFVRKFLLTARQKKPAGVNYFCDAAILARGGIPSIVFGPGDIAQAHTDDEWVSQKSLEGATALLVKFLRDLP